MKRIWNDLLNLLFPNTCCLCKKLLIEGETQICVGCLCHLPHTEYHLCPEDNPVLHLVIDRETVRYAGAFLHYEKGGHVQQLIHALKYYGKKEMGYQLGKQAALELKENNNPMCRADLIIPVPLHKHKYRKRGYNQSEWIAKGMASVLDIPIRTTPLIRHGRTESQTRHKGYDRWLNVCDIFSVTHPEQVQGKHILLVDDVITSGSTAGACIDALAHIPDTTVSLFSLSITR